MWGDNSQQLSIEDLRKVFERFETTVDEDPIKWLIPIRDKLYYMFCSPLQYEYTNEAFKWVSHLCMSFGDLSWVSKDGEWSADESKIFCCIASLSLVEINIILPLIQRHLVHGEDPEIEDGKVVARSATSADYDRFGNYLVILESVIRSIVKDQESSGLGETDIQVNRLIKSMKNRELVNLLDMLKETMTNICGYLELIHRNWESLKNQKNTEKFASAEGALRSACVWLSENPSGIEPESQRFLIDLIVENLLLPDRPTKDDLLILALHSVSTTNNNGASGSLNRTHKFKQALEKYLNDLKLSKSTDDKRAQKMFKLRCGLVKDLMKPEL